MERFDILTPAEKVDKILEIVPDGHDKYKNNVYFHQIVNAVAYGQNEFVSLAILSDMLLNLSNEYSEHLKLMPPKNIMTP